MRQARRAALLALALVLSGPAMGKLPLGSVPPDALGKSKEGAVTVSQFKGRVVVLTFWASWCGPCRRELPALDAMKKLAGDRVEIVAVNVKDPIQSYHAITRQLKGTQMIFTRDTDGKISDRYEVDAYPNLFVIDQNGRIAKSHVGFNESSLAQIIDEVNELLAKPAPAPLANGT